jgi:hypothetical protein
MAEAFIMEEVSNFTIAYYKDGIPTMHNPPPRYNVDESSLNLSLFKWQLGKASAYTTKTLPHDEWRALMFSMSLLHTPLPLSSIYRTSLSLVFSGNF